MKRNGPAIRLIGVRAEVHIERFRRELCAITQSSAGLITAGKASPDNEGTRC